MHTARAVLAMISVHYCFAVKAQVAACMPMQLRLHTCSTEQRRSWRRCTFSAFTAALAAAAAFSVASSSSSAAAAAYALDPRQHITDDTIYVSL